MSKVNKRRARYCHLRTLDEVHNERRKLHRLRRANEAHLREDWEDVKWELSPQNLMDRALAKMSCSWPLFGKVYAGIQTAIALFRGPRNEEPECDCGC
jgi:hypothetical protein